MSRKDYEAIAKVLRETAIDYNNTPQSDPDALIADIAYGLAEYMQKDNRAFDRARFLRAVAHV